MNNLRGQPVLPHKDTQLILTLILILLDFRFNFWALFNCLLYFCLAGLIVFSFLSWKQKQLVCITIKSFKE